MKWLKSDRVASEAEVAQARAAIEALNNTPQQMGALAPSTRRTRRPRGFSAKRINFTGGKQQ